MHGTHRSLRYAKRMAGAYLSYSLPSMKLVGNADSRQIVKNKNEVTVHFL